MTKTYQEWRRWLDAGFKEVHNANHTSWESINDFYRKTDSILGHRDFTEDELELMWYRLVDPLTGLARVEDKMKVWYGVLDKVREVCVGPGEVLKVCPDDPEAHGMYRLLYMHQDSLILLLTILILHETAYKGVVDFVYDCSGHDKLGKTQTKKRAEYLASQGFDVTPAADHFLRNGIAHSSFRVSNDGGALVADALEKPSWMGYDAASASPPPGTKYYTRQELISGFEERQSFIADVMAGVVYWFHVNHGMYQLFDDRFFGSAESGDVREAALSEMKLSSTRDWERILDRFERALP